MGDTVQGTVGLGVLVFGAEGEIIGCLVLAAPTDRLKSNQKKY
jgi:DNA-binding IclR family transcriptional regulator